MARLTISLRWLAAGLACLLSGIAWADDTNSPRVALRGYDPVAYFTEGRPVKGTPEFQQDWDGVRYYFASAENRVAFSASPDRYAPQFASYCSASVGHGRKNEGDPLVWRIVEGKLYLFGKPGPWMDDPMTLARSRAAWPSLR